MITKEMLVEKNACADQVRLFVKTFGPKMKVTLTNCRKAAKVGLNIDWAAEHLLTAPALAEYERVTAPAFAEYKRVKATAWEEYKRVTATAFYKAWKVQKREAAK